MKRALRTFHTIRHLRPRQITARLAYRTARAVRPVPPGARPGTPVPGGSGLRLPPGSPRVRCFEPPGTFHFLERREEFGGGIDWTAPGASRLWRYHLHYFDALRQEDLSEAEAERLILSWIGADGGRCADAWDPYPTATRLVNWCRFYARRGATPPPEVRASVARQARWLSRRIEWHLMGNHLVRNAAGLIHAGALLEGPEAAGWLAAGLDLLAGQTGEQVLGDGGHFERSPMYHALVLEDLLDAIESAAAAGGRSGQRRERLVEAAGAMAGFLEGFRHPDGEIALFNDSALGMAAPSGSLIERAGRVASWRRGTGGGAGEAGPGGLVSWPLTGYHRFDGRRSRLLYDAGPIGPDHQPGHAHADTFSFEMSLDGRRVVTDSGCSTYEPGEVRSHERGTAAHSTLIVDGADQSEVWGAHRVARRARVIDSRMGRSGGAGLIEAAHDGYRRLAGSPVHRRLLRRGGEDLWIVEDRLEGSGVHRIESRLHLAPGAELRQEEDGRAWLARWPGAAIRVRAGGGRTWLSEPGWCATRFGSREQRPVLVLRAEGKAPLEMSYSIEPADRATDSSSSR